MSDTSKPTLKAERLASGGSVVSMPDYEYPFDRAADEQAFLDRADRERRERRNRQAKESKERAKPVNPQERIEELLPQAVRMRELGISDVSICQSLHVGRETLVDRIGPPPRKQTQRLSDEEREAKKSHAKDLRAEGMSFAEIALKVGMSKEGVRLWFQSEEKKAA
jgi:hypothetical protein